jgi:GNAT superfamily N-acetyltransferase
VTFRFAVGSDLGPVMALINRAFVVERFFKSGDRLTVAAMRALFRSGGILLAEDAGALAGCVYVEMRGERAYFGLLSVDPGRQRSGVGRRLTTAVEDFARSHGARHMDIRIVSLREELRGVYEGMGYAVTGTEPIPAGVAAEFTKPCHFVLMSKPLGEAPASSTGPRA